MMSDGTVVVITDEVGDTHIPTIADIRLTECNKWIGNETWRMAEAPTLVTCGTCAAALTGTNIENSHLTEPPPF